MSNVPLIVDIKRHSLEDGPGIRSVVFFKGCPLRCVFCHNPETQDPGVEIAFSSRECIQCGRCEDACPVGAIDLRYPGRIHREWCIRCGTCASVCPGKGLRVIGVNYPVEVLTELLLRDRAFYHHSGGGVTLSGGECTLYPEYLESLLEPLKAKGVHVAVETSGYFDYGSFREKVLPYVDLIYFDIKIADPEAHRQYTERGNERILDNFRHLIAEKGAEIHPRIPLIPGITATRENLSAIVDFLCEVEAERVSLLPYNPMGIDKTMTLGRSRPPLPGAFMDTDEEGAVYALFRAILEDRERPRTTLAQQEIRSCA